MVLDTTAFFDFQRFLHFSLEADYSLVILPIKQWVMKMRSFKKVLMKFSIMTFHIIVISIGNTLNLEGQFEFQIYLSVQRKLFSAFGATKLSCSPLKTSIIVTYTILLKCETRWIWKETEIHQPWSSTLPIRKIELRILHATSNTPLLRRLY